MYNSYVEGNNMITKEEAQEAFDRLSTLRVARIGDSMNGLFLQPLDFGQKLHISALVYAGDKFIPLSVRKAASEPLGIKQALPTWLIFEEELFQISLHYMGSLEGTAPSDLHELTLGFEETAIVWRQIFEEKDRQDLVHVNQPR